MPSVPDLSGRRILVTGASGMVGSRTVRSLLERGATVTAFDLRAYNPDDPAGGTAPDAPLEIIAGDVTDTTDLAPHIRTADVVVHLAAILRMASEERPGRAFDINLAATHRILEVCAESDVDRVVLGSSIGVYGSPASSGHVFTEGDPQVGRSFYEVSKIAAEMYAEAFHRSRGLRYVPLRFGTLYGPGMGRTSVISQLLHEVLDAVEAGRTPQIALDPSNRYDFLFVGDAAESVARAVVTPHTCQPLNVVSGTSTSLGEMVRTLLAIEGCEAEPVWQPDDSLVPTSRQFSAARIGELLDFVPSTTVADGLREFTAWRKAGDSHRGR